MRICENHWKQLREAISARGGDPFIKTAVGAHAEMVAGIEGRPTVRLDPLLAANSMIWENAIRIAGLVLLGARPDGGEWCPICYLVQQCACGQSDCPYTTWVDRAADDAMALVTEGDAPPPVLRREGERKE